MGTYEQADEFLDDYASAFQGQTPQGAERERWMELWAEDATWEGPFLPEPAVVRGRAAIGRLMGRMMDMIPTLTINQLNRYRTDDPDLLIVEGWASGQVLGGGYYNQQYVLFIWLRNGKIAHMREYFSPLRAMKVLGEERLTQAFADLATSSDAANT